MSVGVLAHLFGRKSHEKLAEEIGTEGFSHVQLAIWKAFDSPDFSVPGKLSPGLVRSIRCSFDRYGVSVSVLACYLHLFERDEEKRRNHLERFKELLRYAPSFGTRIVAVEVGKISDGFTDKDLETLHESLQELLAEAEKWGVFIGIEPANDHLIEDARTLKEVFEHYQSNHLGVIIDPGNLLKTENFHRQDEIIQEAFELLGDRILAAHAKDRKLINGELETVPPGHGDMNYPLYMKLLEQYKPGADLIMEHANTPELRDECRQFINRHLNQNSIPAK